MCSRGRDVVADVVCVSYVGMRAECRSNWSDALVQRHVTYVERRIVIIGKVWVMRNCACVRERTW
jgi:hypothetical protein